MSLTALSLPIVLVALFLGVAWLVAAVWLPLWLHAVGHRDALVRSAWLASAVPWLVGLAVAAGAALPGDPHTGRVLACHCAESMPTWLHLCPVHPDEAAWLAIPSVLLLLGLIPGRLRAVLELLREPLGHGGGPQPRIVELDRRIAVLHGWLRPTLVVDRELWSALSEDERAAVLAHERGHLARRDPLVLMLLRGLLTLAPRPIGMRLARIWLDRAERRADVEAARLVGDPLVVAQALVRCARLGASAPPLAAAWTGGQLQDRVQALVQQPRLHEPARPDLGIVDVVVVCAIVVLAALATPWIHHQVEHLLNLSL